MYIVLSRIRNEASKGCYYKNWSNSETDNPEHLIFQVWNDIRLRADGEAFWNLIEECKTETETDS